METTRSGVRGSLPVGATDASRRRYELARELADRCPPELGREIALTGSVARGMADDDSDIEIVAWADELPAADARVRWLRDIGATDFAPNTHTSQDGTIWHWSRYGGVRLETGWQAIAEHERVLQSILAGEESDHRRLTLADAVVHAVPLRTDGSLAGWQQELSRYPSVLRRRLVQAGARRWTFSVAYWALARRGDNLAAAERLVADVQSILRIVFALNRTWEPAWKWARLRTLDLAVQPDRLVERIDGILSMSDLEGSLRRCAELFRDTLELAPKDIDGVGYALATIEQSLRDRGP